MTLARLGRIDLYPIKALDGVSVAAAEIDAAGALRHDRYYALFDDQDRIVNGKRDARIHRIRALYADDFSRVSLSAPGMPDLAAELATETAALENWFSRYFDRTILLRERAPGGFPDDSERPGPTLVSHASLLRVGEWMQAATGVRLAPAELTRRFRTNLELADCAAFAEDTLYGEVVLLGALRLTAVQPCARCVVPTRDSLDGEPLRAFTKVLTERRRAELPPGADPGRFDHFYRLAVNTRIAADQAGTVIRVGDEVRTEFQFGFQL